MSEAQLFNSSPMEGILVVTEAAMASGEVFQDKLGRAAIIAGLSAVALGDSPAYYTAGIFRIPKTASIVILDGGSVYWDHSANKAHFKKVNDRDFYVGRAVGDAASADTDLLVSFNVNPPFDLDMARDPFNSILVGTPAALAISFGYPKRFGGSHFLQLSATSEAQKVDMVSADGFAKGANAIVEFAFRVPNGGSGSASDFSLGIANATHASDADTIADSVFVHLDGGSANIYLESDDGTTEVAATDSTIDFTTGTTNATRVECWMDMRNPADVQIYLDGVLMLPDSVFNVDAYAGPWYLIGHVEKTTGTETADIIVDWMRARFAQQ